MPISSFQMLASVIDDVVTFFLAFCIVGLSSLLSHYFLHPFLVPFQFLLLCVSGFYVLHASFFISSFFLYNMLLQFFILFLFLAFTSVPLFVFTSICREFFFISSTVILYLLSLTLYVGFSLSLSAYLLSQFLGFPFFIRLCIFSCPLASMFAFFSTLCPSSVSCPFLSLAFLGSYALHTDPLVRGKSCLSVCVSVCPF